MHPKGAPHLADPAKLVASATKIFGDQMGRLWGELRAVPADKLRVVQDQEAVAAGGGVFRALDTPGHAQHHHAWLLEKENTLFAGDVLGVCIDGGPCLPPCPPPDINLEQWADSLHRIGRLRPARVFVTHFGELDDAARRMEELRTRLQDWAGWMRAQLNLGLSEQQLVPLFEQRVWAELRQAGLGDEMVATYEQADPAAMSVGGLARYWRKHRPAELK